MQNIPQRHHYIPVFYLKQWALNNGMLCEYSKPHGQVVKPKRVAPKATGYVDGLYELQGLEGEFAQQFERLFLSPVDSLAAVFLQDLVLNRKPLRGSESRSQWTRFLVSLIMRMPEEIAGHKKYYQEDWFEYSIERERDYKRHRDPKSPATLKEWLRNSDPLLVQRLAMRSLIPLIDNPDLGEAIARMRWGHLNFPLDAPALMTSDRPLFMSENLIDKRSFILLPVSPKKAFIACGSLNQQISFERVHPTVLARMINDTVVQQAYKYVYSTYDVQLAYVQSNMGRAPLPSFAEKMRNLRNLRKSKQ